MRELTQAIYNFIQHFSDNPRSSVSTKSLLQILSILAPLYTNLRRSYGIAIQYTRLVTRPANSSGACCPSSMNQYQSDTRWNGHPSMRFGNSNSNIEFYRFVQRLLPRRRAPQRRLPSTPPAGPTHAVPPPNPLDASALGATIRRHAHSSGGESIASPWPCSAASEVHAASDVLPTSR